MVESENLWVKVKGVFYNQHKMQDLLHNNWSVQMFWFPFNGNYKLGEEDIEFTESKIYLYICKYALYLVFAPTSYHRHD